MLKYQRLRVIDILLFFTFVVQVLAFFPTRHLTVYDMLGTSHVVTTEQGIFLFLSEHRSVKHDEATSFELYEKSRVSQNPDSQARPHPEVDTVMKHLAKDAQPEPPIIKFPKQFTERRKPMTAAITEIQNGNAAVDVIEKHDDTAHFDGEIFFAGQLRIRRAVRRMRKRLRQDNIAEARKELGKCLHSIQDFYSHSNWVELGELDVHPELGANFSNSTFSNAAGPEIHTCNVCKYKPTPLEIKEHSIKEEAELAINGTASQHETGQEHSTTGQEKQRHGSAQRALRKFKDKTSQKLQATIRKSRISCAEGCKRGDSVLSAGLGIICSFRCEKPDCSSNCEVDPPNRKLLTTGYYAAERPKEPTADKLNNSTAEEPKTPSPHERGKCHHGGLFNFGAMGFEGINKYSARPLFSPHWYFHKAAVAMAIKATSKFIKDLEDKH